MTAMQLITSTTVGTGGIAEIDLTSIPQTFTDLVLKASVMTNASTDPNEAISIRFNSSSTSYTQRNLQGNGQGSVSSFAAPTTSIRIISGGRNVFASADVYIPNYTGSTNKSVSSEGVSELNGATEVYALFTAGLWSVTDAISSIKLIKLDGAQFLENSVVSLYGITAGSDGIVTTS